MKIVNPFEQKAIESAKEFGFEVNWNCDIFCSVDKHMAIEAITYQDRIVNVGGRERLMVESVSLCAIKEKVIEINQHLEELEKLVSFAHEYGHVADLIKNYDNNIDFYCIEDEYKIEKRAWDIGEKFLQENFETSENLWRTTFELWKTDCLKTYERS